MAPSDPEKPARRYLFDPERAARRRIAKEDRRSLALRIRTDGIPSSTPNLDENSPQENPSFEE